MNNNLIKRYGLVGLLIITALGMGIIKLAYKDKDWQVEEKNKTSHQITVSPRDKLTPTVETRTLESLKFEKEYPLWALLPYSGNGFTVDRYIEANTLVVIPEGLDKKIVIKEVEKWLESNGQASDSHKLVIENLD